MKAWKASIEPFEAPQRSVTINLNTTFWNARGKNGQQDQSWSLYPAYHIQQPLKQDPREVLWKHKYLR